MRLALAVLAGCLAGCQTHPMTLDEAQAACTKKGGLLFIIYTTPVTLAGPGTEVASPGDCISPDKFDIPPPKPTPPPAH